jgi:hypothetical protein
MGVSILVLVIDADSSPTHFSVKIRCHFCRGLEIGEIFLGGVSSSSLDSASLPRGGRRASIGLVQAACWHCWLRWATMWAARREEAGPGLGRVKNRKGGGESRDGLGQTHIPAGFRPIAK